MKRAPIEFVEWWCGDDECDCTQWQIRKVGPNPNAPGWVIPTTLWEGEFHTDHEVATDDEFRAAVAAAHELGAFVYATSNTVERCAELGIEPPPVWTG